MATVVGSTVSDQTLYAFLPHIFVLLALVVALFTAYSARQLGRTAPVPKQSYGWWHKSRGPTQHKPRIAIDISPTLHQPYGPGHYIEALIRHIPNVRGQERLEYILFSASKRHRMPAWVEDLTRANDNFAAVHYDWSSRRLEWSAVFSDLGFVRDLVGPVQVFHSSAYLHIRPRYAKSVVHVHDLSFALHWLALRRFNDPRELSARWRAARADRIVTVSETSKQDIQEVLGVPEEDIVVLPGAADPTNFRPVDDRRELERELSPWRAEGVKADRYFLYVGDTHRRKNLPRILRASETVIAGRPDIRLVLAGLEKDDIAPFVNGHPTDFLVPLKYVDRAKLRFLYAAAIALVYPSLYEGYGLPIIEAMACGAPVITSRRIEGYGGATEETTHGVAELVDPRNVDEMSEAMIRLLEDKDRRQELREKGRDVASQYSWAQTAERAVRLYDELSAEEVSVRRTRQTVSSRLKLGVAWWRPDLWVAIAGTCVGFILVTRGLAEQSIGYSVIGITTSLSSIAYLAWLDRW